VPVTVIIAALPATPTVTLPPEVAISTLLVPLATLADVAADTPVH